MENFWNFFLLIVEVFLFMAYLIVFFHIIADLFRDTKMGGAAKALWVVFLIVLPLIGSLIYLIVRGRGMEQRRADAAALAQRSMDEYIRKAAGANPAETIAEAHRLLQSGVISPAEFATIKAKALAD